MQRAREATIRLSYGSCAKYVILPLQDLLGTGAQSRMNTPGTLSDRNWSWRYEKDDLKNTADDVKDSMSDNNSSTSSASNSQTAN